MDKEQEYHHLYEKVAQKYKANFTFTVSQREAGLQK